jgi:hypothetical protein
MRRDVLEAIKWLLDWALNQKPAPKPETER